VSDEGYQWMKSSKNLDHGSSDLSWELNTSFV
jgi:hypothetical protein